MGASKGQSAANPWTLEQLCLHAEGGLARWKEAYVWPGATLPPAELRERERGERLDPEYQLSAEPPLPARPGPRPPAPAARSERSFTKGGAAGEGQPRGAHGPGIGPESYPRLSARVILTGIPAWVT